MSIPNLSGSNLDFCSSLSDPLQALGAMCGLDGLTTNADGYCCLAIGTQIVHLHRWVGSTRIRLSTEVNALSQPLETASRDVKIALTTMRAEEIDIRVLDDDAFCLQSVFDSPVQGFGNGPALLKAIDALLRHAARWQEVVSTSFLAATSFAMPAELGFKGR